MEIRTFCWKKEFKFVSFDSADITFTDFQNCIIKKFKEFKDIDEIAAIKFHDDGAYFISIEDTQDVHILFSECHRDGIVHIYKQEDLNSNSNDLDISLVLKQIEDLDCNIYSLKKLLTGMIRSAQQNVTEQRQPVQIETPAVVVEPAMPPSLNENIHPSTLPPSGLPVSTPLRTMINDQCTRQELPLPPVMPSARPFLPQAPGGQTYEQPGVVDSRVADLTTSVHSSLMDMRSPTVYSSDSMIPTNLPPRYPGLPQPGQSVPWYPGAAMTDSVPRPYDSAADNNQYSYPPSNFAVPPISSLPRMNYDENRHDQQFFKYSQPPRTPQNYSIQQDINIPSSINTRPPIGGHQMNMPPIGSHQMNMPPTGSHQMNMPPTGSHQMNMPPTGGYQMNMLPTSGNQMNMPPTGGNQMNMPPTGGNQMNMPPTGGHQMNMPPTGGNQMNMPPTGGNQMNMPPTGAFPMNMPRPSFPPTTYSSYMEQNPSQSSYPRY